MNIFENYLSEISNLILKNKDILKLKYLENLNSINLEVPPEHYDFDLSTNISLVLAKTNKMHPKNLAKDIKKLLKTIKKYLRQRRLKNSFCLMCVYIYIYIYI